MHKLQTADPMNDSASRFFRLLLMLVRHWQCSASMLTVCRPYLFIAVVSSAANMSANVSTWKMLEPCERVSGKTVCLWWFLGPNNGNAVRRTHPMDIWSRCSHFVCFIGLNLKQNCIHFNFNYFDTLEHAFDAACAFSARAPSHVRHECRTFGCRMHILVWVRAQNRPLGNHCHFFTFLKIEHLQTLCICVFEFK